MSAQSAVKSPAPTTPAELDAVLSSMEQASTAWARTSPADRAAALESAADSLDAAVQSLIPIAVEETHLTEARLNGELKRTSFQLRLFASELREGGCLDARIDHADPAWPMGAPRPDLRRLMEPVGPVLVFSASNFPFAFSVAGGDTASALAAGCAVVVKAHSGHPALSAATAEALVAGLAAAGAPQGLLQVVYGTDAGRDALADPRVKAAGFTGSIPGGRALFDIANSRPSPIPFYGELGSNNPVFVTAAAAAADAEQIVEGFLASFTASAGQFCTKPGTLFVPAGSDIVGLLRAATLPEPAPLLNERIRKGFAESLTEMREKHQIAVLAGGGAGEPDVGPQPTLLSTTARDMLAAPHELQQECFGPAAVIVEYDDESQLVELAETFEGQLTATIFGTGTDEVSDLVSVLSRKAGRLLWCQWPTGVSVTYAQQHGGPYPATTFAGATSVGTAAIDRFLRPVAFQGFPQHLLPPALKDDNPLGVPQLLNGRRSEG